MHCKGTQIVDNKIESLFLKECIDDKINRYIWMPTTTQITLLSRPHGRGVYLHNERSHPCKEVICNGEQWKHHPCGTQHLSLKSGYPCIPMGLENYLSLLERLINQTGSDSLVFDLGKCSVVSNRHELVQMGPSWVLRINKPTLILEMKKMQKISLKANAHFDHKQIFNDKKNDPVVIKKLVLDDRRHHQGHSPLNTRNWHQNRVQQKSFRFFYYNNHGNSEKW